MTVLSSEQSEYPEYNSPLHYGKYSSHPWFILRPVSGHPGLKPNSLLEGCGPEDPSSPKNYRPISLLCITYKLYERLLLQRLMPLIDTKLTKDQAGFRPGRSCAGQLLNLTQHIEDGFEGKQITGAAFIDLSAAYDTVQHRTMVRKLLDMTGDLNLCQVIKSLLNNRRFYVQLNDQRSKWKAQKNGLPQAEYACSSWSRSRHTKLVDTALNDTCRIITGCVKTTPVPCLYALAGISPPHIRRLGIAQDERKTQETDIRHPLHGHVAPPHRLRSRASFVQTVLPLQTTKQAARTNIWEDEWQINYTRALEWLDRGITPTESLASGHDLGWTTWKSLNRLRVEQWRCKALMKVWSYTTEDTCSCGSVQAMSHLLECADAPRCSPEDLAEPTPSAVACARYWQNDI
ncbi:hypothetical protein JOQ06_011888 [Pogonophryne albipinna]|uniref:Reverse transcriptase domain-containing protein n=1 Tax=Pogonophryne albipinna TaxID=1090488 RepID=A0AAD6BFM1_9TELE|nr:hypothetical protein JOQ06_011888 [Pogonophryne albipinna]